MSIDQKRALWDAINKYVVACGGDPGKRVYGNVTRMEAVVEVERALAPDAGADLLAREQVRPLVDRFLGIQHNLNQWQQLIVITKDGIKHLDEALAHARKLGF